jgi:preprotein translocase subunit SecG
MRYSKFIMVTTSLVGVLLMHSCKKNNSNAIFSTDFASLVFSHQNIQE